MASDDQGLGTDGRARPAGVPEVSVSKDPVHVRRRRLAAGALLGAVLLGGWGMAQVFGGDDSSAGQGESVAGPTEATAPQQGSAGGDGSGDGEGDASSEESSTTDEAPEESAEESADAADDPAGGEDDADQVWQREAAAAEHASDTTALEQVDYLTGGLTPKSVMASGHGLMIANNMMYSHTSTVFDSTTREQVEVLDDGVDLAAFGIEGHPGVSQGSPVEAVWTEDGRYAYVSQYTMYGQNFGVEGFDACTRDSGVGASFVYRFDAQEMAWDQVFRVGAVPKYLALSPDQRTLLVSNWCDATLSVVDTEKGEETGTVELAAAPRGLAIMPDNRTVYAVAMYADELYKVDLAEGTAEVVMQTPPRPRHLNLADEGRTLYLTTSGGNAILKIDTATDEVVDEAAPGAEPRSVALSPDEKALYVVNYDEASVSKVRTSDMEVIDTVGVDANPIGIDYDPVTHTVWVACYGGSIYVFDDQDSLL